MIKLDPLSILPGGPLGAEFLGFTRFVVEFYGSSTTGWRDVRRHSLLRTPDVTGTLHNTSDATELTEVGITDQQVRAAFNRVSDITTIVEYRVPGGTPAWTVEANYPEPILPYALRVRLRNEFTNAPISVRVTGHIGGFAIILANAEGLFFGNVSHAFTVVLNYP